MRKRTRIATVGGCIAGVAFAAACYASWRADAACLREVAESVTAGADTPSERVLALVHWVRRIEGSGQNDHHFLIKAWRATPMQILDGGGDCADKSRLLTALLSEVGVKATMALCFDEKSGAPAHTIVEAAIEDGGFMAVDPAYDLYFPKPGGGYHGLVDLRRDHTIVTRRVEQLMAEMPDARATDAYYLRSAAAYHTAATINWNKNALTRLAAPLVRHWWGHEAYRIRRPLVLEEPKLAATAVATTAAAVCLAVLLGGRWVERRRRKRTVTPNGARSNVQDRGVHDTASREVVHPCGL